MELVNVSSSNFIDFQQKNYKIVSRTEWCKEDSNTFANIAKIKFSCEIQLCNRR